MGRQPLNILLIEFLYIDPLKQGLKLVDAIGARNKENVFIHRSIKTRIETENQSITIRLHNVFIHRSIKTRIETPKQIHHNKILKQFLYIDPLKQGLKQCKSYDSSSYATGFYT